MTTAARHSRTIIQPARGAAGRDAGGTSQAWPDARSQLAAIVEHSNDAIFSRTLDGVVTTWNAAAERIFGYPAREIIGRSSRLLLPRGQRDEFKNLLTHLRRGEVVQHFETDRLRKGGRHIHVSLTLSPVFDAAHRLVGFSTIARDITAERHMIQTLARREHELQDLFEEASVGVVLTARNGRILRANGAFCDLIERDPERVMGRTLDDFHPDPAQVAAWLEQLGQRQTLHNLTTQLVTPAGEVRHVLADANTLWERGTFVHARWFVRDISRRKQLEHELLELTERERRSFARELHDGLGQQLGGIAYLGNVLREKLTERGAPEAGDATRIYNLVRAAIEHTRGISRGLSPILPGPDGLAIALQELASQTTALFRLKCQFTARTPVLVEDASLSAHLYRIAQEAVNNALKHARARRLSIRLSRVRGTVTLTVRDDGAGIGPLSPRRQGLGLHLMHHRAGLIQGTLQVQPHRRGGTEVICRAPCVAPEKRLIKSRQPRHGKTAKP